MVKPKMHPINTHQDTMRPSSGTLTMSVPYTESKCNLATQSQDGILRTKLVNSHALSVLLMVKAQKGKNASLGECHQGSWRVRVIKERYSTIFCFIS
jgi:hypothetical protein